MTHDDFIQIERIACRAFTGAKSWTDNRQTYERLQQAEFLLAEMRNAAHYLCDPNETPELKAEVSARLLEVFTMQLR